MRFASILPLALRLLVQGFDGRMAIRSAPQNRCQAVGQRLVLVGAIKEKRCRMIFEYVLGSIVTVLITAYLIYALLRPERF